jgi:hypothetical protein
LTVRVTWKGRARPYAAQQLGAPHNERAMDTQHLVFPSHRRYIY